MNKIVYNMPPFLAKHNIYVVNETGEILFNQKCELNEARQLIASLATEYGTNKVAISGSQYLKEYVSKVLLIDYSNLEIELV